MATQPLQRCVSRSGVRAGRHRGMARETQPASKRGGVWSKTGQRVCEALGYSASVLGLHKKIVNL
jgi:hypothetical protein